MNDSIDSDGSLYSGTGAKTINDPIHGHIELNDELFKIIDTAPFQRLRELKQLGGMYYVFPGATHNRFEHSLGTCYLAGEWMRHFQKLVGTNVVSDRDIFLVEVAGLCHDLGHGPFSHMFEAVVAPGLGLSWDHEEASCLLLEKINKETNVLQESELSRVQDMIHGRVPEDDTKRTFMYQVVHNQFNSVDVDKFDYLCRDSRSANLSMSFDPKRLMKFSSIDIYSVNPTYQISFLFKEGLNLFTMFHSRYSLHKQVYTHQVVKSVELMIGDIMAAVNDEFQIADILNKKDMDRYTLLTDSLLSDIPRRIAFSTSPPTEGLKKATRLLKGLRDRKLYKFVSIVNVFPEHIKHAKDLVNSATEYLEKETKSKEFAVVKVVINFAMQDKNPLLYVPFYNNNSGCFLIKDMREISECHASMRFEEATLRVFSKVSDLAFRNKLSDAFETWANKIPDQVSTPTHSSKHKIGVSSSGKKHLAPVDRDMSNPKKLKFDNTEEE